MKMRTFLLLLCMLPCIAFAGNLPKSIKNIEAFKKVNQQSRLRSDQTIVLDSTYTFSGTEKRLNSITKYIYDKQGRIAEEEYTYNMDNLEFKRFEKSIYNYKDDFSYPSEQRNYILIDGEWVEDSKSSLEYSKGIVPIETRDSCFLNGEWYLEELIQAKEFDEEGYPIMFESTSWEGGSSPEYASFAFTYDKNYMVETMKHFLLYQEKNEWIHVQTNHFKWDQNGCLLRDYAEEYDSDKGEWIESYEIIYTYDERNNLIEENESMYGISYSSINHQNFYSDKVITVNKQIAPFSDIKIINNPSSHILTVDLGEQTKGTIIIIDTAGKMVLNKILSSNSNEIPLQLRFGFHIVKVKTDKGTFTEKIFIR